MFEWIATNFNPAAAVLIAILCATGGILVTVRAFRASRSDVPWLLRLGMRMALLISLVALPMCIAGLLGLVDIEGDLPRRGEFEIILSLTVISAVLGASAVGYYSNRESSRRLAVAFWPLLLGCLLIQFRWLPGFGRNEVLLASGEALLFTAISAWYFYRKRAVVTYYERLERRLTSGCS